jgi:hypothetical protein
VKNVTLEPGLKASRRAADRVRMLLVALVIVAALTVPLFGGRLGRLADVRLRHAWSLGAALALQILIISVVPSLPEVLGQVVHLVTYALAAVFLVANRDLVGFWVVALGTACNVIAIAANNGVMPATEGALRTAGLATASAEFENSTVVDGARLQFLGDVFAIPKSWPLANVFSVGDVLIVVGVALVLHTCCGSRLAPMLRLPRKRQELPVSP